MPTSLPRRQEESIIAGLRAQLERSTKFTSTIDPVASATALYRITKLLEPQEAELRVKAGLPPKAPPMARRRAYTQRLYSRAPVPSDRVFTYWNNPIDEAPPLVQACLKQLAKIYPSLRILDGAGVRELIEVPDRVADLLEKDRPAHFSDYIRTRILAEHGGLWFDATTWVHRRLDGALQRYLRAGTVFPRWTRTSIGNWFIASHPRTPLIMMQYLALNAWWDAFDDLPDYFLYHRIFEVITTFVPEVRGQWDATPALSSTAAHLLQLDMMQPWDSRRVLRTLDQAPLQKLSYKYDSVPTGSVLERLLTTGLAA